MLWESTLVTWRYGIIELSARRWVGRPHCEDNDLEAGTEMLRMLGSHLRVRLTCCVREIRMPPGKAVGGTLKK